MEPTSAWRPLRRPDRPGGAVSTPFARLARTHAFMVAGDTLVAVALAGSLFFSISPTAARGRVALYLLLTMAPFAVVAPLIGPAIDRRPGGRRAMVLLSAGARAGICLLMIDDVDSLLLFPEAFAVLVLAKGYAVAKSAMVPGLVGDRSALVEANSKLTLVSGIVGFLAGVPGAAMLQLGGAEWVIAMAVVAFAGATVSSLRLPKVAVPAADVGTVDAPVGARVLLAASSMAVLRAVVGFLTFLLAFDFRADGAPAWWFGLVLAASAGGSLAGAGIAPRLRRSVHEEHLLAGCVAAVALAAVVVTPLGGLAGAAALAAVVGVAASAAKQGFDAIVQREAPESDKARSFARYETRFQIVWVVGAFIPVVVPVVFRFPVGLGYALIAGAAGLGAASYLLGLRAVEHHPHRVPRPITGRFASRLPSWHSVAGRVRERWTARTAARSAAAAPDPPETRAGVPPAGDDQDRGTGRHPHP